MRALHWYVPRIGVLFMSNAVSRSGSITTSRVRAVQLRLGSAPQKKLGNPKVNRWPRIGQHALQVGKSSCRR